MNYDVANHPNATLVALTGEIDLETSREARKVLLDAVGHGKPLLVDLAGVSYIDSSGVASLVEALQNAKKAGQTFGLVAVSESALRVLQLARLDKIFTIHATQDEALAALG